MGVDAPLDAGGDCVERNRKRLFDEFGHVLEESLILSIARDYNIETDYDELRQVLSALAEPATAEAATGFDPSGLGYTSSELDGLRADGTTVTSDNRLSDESSGDYSVTTASSSDVYSDCLENLKLTDQAELSEDEKVKQLQGIFIKQFSEHTLKTTLNDTGGNLDRAFDILLNRQYLQDAGHITKGIDAFFEPNETRQKLSKAKSARRKEKAKAKKSQLPVNYKAVSSTSEAQELQSANDFVQPAGSASRLSAARRPATPTIKPGVNLQAPASPARSSPITPSTAPLDYRGHIRAAANLSRLGPFGRQGVSVYTDRARDEARAAIAQASALADTHVGLQSTDTSVDLHGVYVLDGVRIARERVWAWWQALDGENRAAAAKNSGFTVVTGLGRHSHNGVSRLRQAVGAMLRNDGWKVETLTGHFHVTGRV